MHLLHLLKHNKCVHRTQYMGTFPGGQQGCEALVDHKVHGRCTEMLDGISCNPIVPHSQELRNIEFAGEGV